MGVSKFKNLFAKSSKTSKRPSNKKSTESPKIDLELEKKEVQKYQEILSTKLKDPKMAKKAALIIEQMLNEPKKSNKKAS